MQKNFLFWSESGNGVELHQILSADFTVSILFFSFWEHKYILFIKIL